MIEEQGRVIAVERGTVWVETLRRTGCGRCDEPGGCGNPDGARVARARERVGQVKAVNGTRDELAVGDIVRVGVPADAVLRGALTVYLLPLAMLVLGTALGDRLAPGDVGALAGAAAGLAAGFVSLRVLARYAPAPPGPVVLARIAAPPGNECPH